MKKPLLALIVASLTALVACQAKAPATDTPQGKGAVNVFNWSAYLPDDVKADFTKETGIKLNYEEYDSNETMLAKVTAGADYDVVFPSQDFVPVMIQKDLLLPLDKSKIPNFANIDADVVEMTQSFDKGNAYSVPYNIGATGILYWKDKVPDPPHSFSVLLDPKLKGKILLINDMREIYGAALHTLGFSANTVDPAQLDKATGLILKWKANILKFENDQAPTLFDNKDVWLAFQYPENIYSTLDDAKKAQVGFFLPKEANVKYLDNMVILKTAKNVDNAYAFINFIYRPDILARIFDAYGYPGISAKANALRKSQPLYTAADLKNHEFRMPLGDKLDLYNKPWQEKVLIGQ